MCDAARMSKHISTKTCRAQHAQVIAPRWLTLKAAAVYSGVSEQTIRNWAKAGHLTLHNVTVMGGRGRVLVDRLELDALIESYAGAPASKLAMNEKGGAQ
jgi:excisionase family DNA binding protein